MITELKRFIIVAELGSITKASEGLFITQPALTQSINRLEDELGYSLFQQNGKRIFLTEQGKVVYKIAKEVLSLWAKAKIVNERSTYTPCINIGLFDNAAIQLSEFLSKKMKTINLGIQINRSEDLLKKLQYGLLDLCVCVVPRNIHQYSNITLVKTYQEKLIPVSGQTWSNVNEIPFILYVKDSKTQKYIDETFIKSNISPLVVAEAVNPQFMKELAAQNFGVAILPENMVNNDIKNKKLIEQKLPFTFERTCGIFIAKADQKPNAIAILQEISPALNIPKVNLTGARFL